MHKIYNLSYILFVYIEFRGFYIFYTSTLIEVFIRRQAEARGAVFVTIGFFVLNDPATAGWNENRIAAVLTWIQQGGTLIV